MVASVDRVAEVRMGIARGWDFVPLQGKRPVLDNWAALPRASDAQMLEWARLGNVGIRTGSKSDLVLIDVDTRKGGNVAALGELPRCPVVKTGGGGAHLYFRPPPGIVIRNSVGRLGPHIDVRGENGQCVYVGSMHPETRQVYRWAVHPDEVAPPIIPARLVTMLLPRTTQRTSAPALSRASGTSRYGQAALDRSVVEVSKAQEGTRNDTLNRAAYGIGRLIAGGEIEEAAAFGALTAAAQACGLDEREYVATLSGAIESGKKNPRSRPLRSVADIPKTDAAARWLGSVSRDKPGAEAARDSLPDDLRTAFDEAAASEKRHQRPETIDSTAAKRIQREISSDLSKPFDVEIVRLRRIAQPGGRATFTLRVRGGADEVTLSGLSGAQLLAYTNIACLAIEQGLVLPRVAKDTSHAWHSLVEDAMQRSDVVDADPEATTTGAIVSSVSDLIARGAEAVTYNDVLRGNVLLRDSLAMVHPQALVARVRHALEFDRPSREQVIEAVRVLGMIESRPRIEGRQPRLWGFPTKRVSGEVLNADDAGPDVQPED